MNAIKSLLIICICLTVMAWKVVGQSPSAAGQTLGSPAAAVSPAVSVSPSPSDESDLEKSIKSRTKKHFHVHVGDKDEDSIDRLFDHKDGDVPGIAIPIIAIIFFSIFGA